MDYAKQSNKEHPFDGLTQEEKKRLLVYMCHVAHPSLSPDEIERKYGEVLPKTELPTVFEALEIAADIKREIKEASSPNPKSPPKPGAPEGGPTNVLLAIILLILAVAAICCWGRYSYVKDKAKRREQRRQAQAEAYRKQKLEADRWQNKFLQLKESAEKLCANIVAPAATVEDFLEMGLKIQNSLESANDSFLSDQKLSLKELMLKCYKNAMSVDNGKIAAEAAYRIALLYLPSKYLTCQYKRVSLSENETVSMKYLKFAADNNHYEALALISRILWINMVDHNNDRIGEQYYSIKNLTQYKEQLATHPNATATDIYNFAHWISNSDPDKSARFMRKAAKMGDSRARQTLLDKGLTIDE